MAEPYTPTNEDVRECYAMSEDGVDFKRVAQERREIREGKTA